MHGQQNVKNKNVSSIDLLFVDRDGGVNRHSFATIRWKRGIRKHSAGVASKRVQFTYVQHVYRDS